MVEGGNGDIGRESGSLVEKSTEINQKKEQEENEEIEKEKPTIKAMSTKLKVLLAGLCISRYFYYTAYSMIAPFFPDEAIRHGVSDTVIGFIFSSYAATCVILSPLSGRLVPKLGARFAYLFGMFGAGLTTLSYGFLDKVAPDEYELFTALAFIIRIAEASFCIISINASMAIIFHQYPVHMQGFVLGITMMFFGAGLTSGPLIGGILYDVGGYELPFYVIGACIMLTVPLNYFVVDKEIDALKEQGSIVELFKTAPGIVIPSIARMNTGIVNSFVLPILSLYLTSTYAIQSKTLEGFIFSILTFGYGVGSPVWGWLGDKPRLLRWSILAGLILVTVSVFFMGPCPWFHIPPYLWLLCVTLFLTGFGTAVGVIIMVDLMEKAKSSGMEDNLALGAMVSGVYYCVYFIGTAIGPILGGVFYELYGFAWTTTAAGFISILTCLLYGGFMVRETHLARKRQEYSDLEKNGVQLSEFPANNEKIPLSQSYPQYTQN
ncbi:MFS-type transporter SLC18B1-like [Ptychodera flava]|uniref:MFS-type transporter SLC18B1-like n=1 Tax=Ptychodera flava TaxID=63121 RepID=UPI00396A5B0A